MAAAAPPFGIDLAISYHVLRIPANYSLGRPIPSQRDLDRIQYCMENGYVIGPMTYSEGETAILQVVYRPYTNAIAQPLNNRIQPVAGQAANHVAIPVGGTRKNKRTKRHSKKSRANRH